MRTDDFEEFQNAKNYGKITRNRRGTYELHFPTKLNKELKTLMNKDFEMDILGDDENLQVILTDKASSEKINLAITRTSKPRE